MTLVSPLFYLGFLSFLLCIFIKGCYVIFSMYNPHLIGMLSAERKKSQDIRKTKLLYRIEQNIDRVGFWIADSYSLGSEVHVDVCPLLTDCDAVSSLVSVVLDLYS